MIDDVLDCIFINHRMFGSGPAWMAIPLLKALVHRSLWKHFRWGNIAPVSFCVICDLCLYYQDIPGATSPCVCGIWVCVRFQGWAYISFTWPPGACTMRLRRKQHATVLFMVFHVPLGTILVAQPWLLTSSKEGKKWSALPVRARTTAPLLIFIAILFQWPPLPPPSSQSWTRSFVVSEGSQAGNNWLKVTSSGLRGRLGLHLPPECLPFFCLYC